MYIKRIADPQKHKALEAAGGLAGLGGWGHAPAPTDSVMVSQSPGGVTQFVGGLAVCVLTGCCAEVKVSPLLPTGWGVPTMSLPQSLRSIQVIWNLPLSKPPLSRPRVPGKQRKESAGLVSGTCGAPVSIPPGDVILPRDVPQAAASSYLNLSHGGGSAQHPLTLLPPTALWKLPFPHP